MKIVIDMQGAQTQSRHRGIGRYCLAVTRAFVEQCHGSHDTTLLFNAALDGIDEAIDALATEGDPIRRRVVGPLRGVSFDNRANDARRRAAEHVFTHALDVGQPDVVWLSSVVEGFLDDAVVPHASPDAFTVATLYDLIPLHDVEHLGQARPRDWYMHRIDVLKRSDLLLAISEWVRSDAIERLGIDPDRIVAIGAGVDSRFAPPAAATDHRAALRDRFGITRRFVMYNGGFDRRKNVVALIQAYGSLPEALRASHVLVLVGRVDALLSKQFTRSIVSAGLRADEVVFTGFVSDADLVRLYQACALFVFPSEREGFGLAPLEAMACGAPAIANDATSLPEVVGNPEALFDALRPGAMAALIEAVLTDDALAARLRVSGLERASQFSWTAVATRALTAITSAVNDARRPSRRDRITREVSLPVYRMDASNIAATLPLLRQWPGTVTWSGPLPATGPTLYADRFRIGGYAALLEPADASGWLAMLEEEAIGMHREETVDETAWHGHPIARQRRVEDAIATTIASALSDDDLARVADALTRATPGRRTRWLVDVTHIATNDLGTGVHRVVRSILREWLLSPPEGIRIEPVAFRGGRFHHAHDYACQLIGAAPTDPLPGDLVAITGSEVYVGLDWTMESLPSSTPLLRGWRRAGVRMHFVVYDLLPLTMPDAFHAQSRDSFTRWLKSMTGLADALHCISRTTAMDVMAWQRENITGRMPAVDSFELGTGTEARRQGGQLAPELAMAMSARPSLLMVGTIEPRKGHAQVLEAVELLWEAGSNLNLVIVGHRGWLVKELVQRLQDHVERGKRLFWLDDADDETLEAVYERSTALVAASRGEGYGLPLIEAAQRGKPVIARSLPVFREVGGAYPSYFDAETPNGLATHIARWLVDRPRPGSHPAWRTWKESALSLQHVIQITTLCRDDAL